jgi:hypothetical protein
VPRRLSLALIALVMIAFAAWITLEGSALAAPTQQWWWTEGAAEQSLEVSYKLPDNAALMQAGEDIVEATAMGDPYALEDAQSAAAAARRGFTVDYATCQGKGTVWHSEFRTFRCKLDVSSDSDAKTVFVTVHVVGKTTYRINNSGKVWNR